MATTSLAYAQPPNVYELHGDNLKITYTTTSFTGKPFLDYDDGSKIRSFSGDEIRTIGTEIGTLVSVTIRKTVDSGSTTFTVLIPKINLDSTSQTYLQTEAIITRHKFSINPNLNVGQLDSYKFTLMRGTASLRYY
jgi:hypothetical protein